MNKSIELQEKLKKVIKAVDCNLNDLPEEIKIACESFITKVSEVLDIDATAVYSKKCGTYKMDFMNVKESTEVLDIFTKSDFDLTVAINPDGCVCVEFDLGD